MREQRVQLLTFSGCPLADTARESLEHALATLGLTDFEEVDLLDPRVPKDVKAWGSPTILVDGKDVTGSAKADGLGCRIYSGPSKVPTSDEIVRFMRRARRA